MTQLCSSSPQERKSTWLAVRVTVSILAVLVSGAGSQAVQGQKIDASPSTGSANLASLRFRDVTDAQIPGLENTNACWADVNGDGWPDLCANELWINHPQVGFRRSEQAFGSVVAADCDNDGDVDLFSMSQQRLWINQGASQFTEATLPALPRSVSRGAAWGDFNHDGFVDLYVGGYEDWDAGLTFPDLILLNREGRQFELAWHNDQRRARGVTACDFDEDGDLDVYVSNYRLQPNFLWQNNGRAELQDVAQVKNALATSPDFDGGHSIGAVWGDFNNDGHFDLFAGNFAHVDSRGDQPKSRFLKQIVQGASRTFDDLGPCGIHYQESYATPAAADIDNDGDLDLFFTTVYATASFGRPNAPALFENQAEFTFADVTEATGLNGLPPTYQAAFADFDRDGDVDLVSGGRLFENQTSQQHWLEVKLSGDGEKINRLAIGAQVRIRLGDRTLTRQVEAGTGEGNQNEPTLHFGLGNHAEPVTLEVLWPGGEIQTVTDRSVDQLHVITFDQTIVDAAR